MDQYGCIVVKCFLFDGRDVVCEMVWMGQVVDWFKYFDGYYLKCELDVLNGLEEQEKIMKFIGVFVFLLVMVMLVLLVICFFKYDQIFGMNCMCFYDCLGSMMVVIIGVVEVCLFSIECQIEVSIFFSSMRQIKIGLFLVSIIVVFIVIGVLEVVDVFKFLFLGLEV